MEPHLAWQPSWDTAQRLLGESAAEPLSKEAPTTQTLTVQSSVHTSFYISSWRATLDVTTQHNTADNPWMAPVAGVCFYQKESLPGYSAIFRHPDDELNFCYYLIPHGKEGYCGDVKVRVPTWGL